MSAQRCAQPSKACLGVLETLQIAPPRVSVCICAELYKEPTGNLSSLMHLAVTLSADGCPLPKSPREFLSMEINQDYPEGDLGNCSLPLSEEVVVLADYRTAQSSLLNAERSTDSLSRCENLTNWKHLHIWANEDRGRAEGVKMEPRNRASVSASVPHTRRGELRWCPSQRSPSTMALGDWKMSLHGKAQTKPSQGSREVLPWGRWSGGHGVALGW